MLTHLFFGFINSLIKKDNAIDMRSLVVFLDSFADYELVTLERLVTG